MSCNITYKIYRETLKELRPYGFVTDCKYTSPHGNPVIGKNNFTVGFPVTLGNGPFLVIVN